LPNNEYNSDAGDFVDAVENLRDYDVGRARNEKQCRVPQCHQVEDEPPPARKPAAGIKFDGAERDILCH